MSTLLKIFILFLSELITGYCPLSHKIKSGTGIDALDIQAMKDNGIPVCNIPDYGAAAVAECALLLLMAVSKGYATVSSEILRTGWCDPDLPNVRGIDLCGKVCGLIGIGHIGSHFAMHALGLGMKVKAVDPNVSATEMAGLGIEKINSIDELCNCADVLGVFLALSDRTKGILSKERIGMLKRSAIVINVARGALVDEAALAEALRQKRIKGVGKY